MYLTFAAAVTAWVHFVLGLAYLVYQNENYDDYDELVQVLRLNNYNQSKRCGSLK